jgi:hypothetical protein
LAGNSLLYYEVSHININQYVAHAINFPVIAALSFLTSIVLWWTRGVSIRKLGGRFTKIELLMFFSAQCGFAILAGAIGLPYMQASLVNTVVFGLVHYRLLDKKAFVKTVSA